MSKFIFSLGIINKNLLLPIIYMIINICIYIYYNFFVYNEAAYFLEGISCAIGLILIVFISAIYKYRRVIHQKKKKSNKNYFIDYLILFFSSVVYDVSIYLQAYAGEIYKGEENSALDLHVNNALEIIFITLATYNLFL